MTRHRPFILVVIAGELIIGSVLLALRLREMTPPRPDVSIFDSVTTGELRNAAKECETPDQWAELGELYIAHGYFREGEACLREASKHKPEDADLAFRHGFALERFGRLEEANDRYREAILYRHSRTPDIRHYLGRNFLRMDQEEPARDSFVKAGAMPGAEYERARINLRAGRTESAEGAARSLAAAHPTAAQPIALLFRVAIARGDYAGAVRFVDQFDRQSAQLPAPFDVEFKRLNDLHDDFGIAKRKKELEKLLGAGPSAKIGVLDGLSKLITSADWTPMAADQRAEVEYRTGRFKEAIGWLDDAIARDGPAWQLLERLGDTHRESGDAEKALVNWERAASLGTGPELKNLRHKLALAHEKAGRKEAATSYHALAALSAGIEAFEAVRPADAVAAFTEATRLNPRLAHAWYYLGECHRLQNRPTEALTAYEHCLRIDPDHGRAIGAQRLLPK